MSPSNSFFSVHAITISNGMFSSADEDEKVMYALESF